MALFDKINDLNIVIKEFECSYSKIEKENNSLNITLITILVIVIAISIILYVFKGKFKFKKNKEKIVKNVIDNTDVI